MTYSSIADSFPEDNIVDVEMNDGRIIKCKKISRKLLSEMVEFLPELKNLTFLVSDGLERVASLGGKELYLAMGDVSKCVSSHNGGILSQTKDANGKFNGAVSFVNSGLKMGGVKATASVSKAIPWIGLAITVFEVGANIVKREKAIKNEERKYYTDSISELKEQYDMLWVALNDYPIAVADDAMRKVYIPKILNAYDISNTKFNRVREEIEKAKSINHIAAQTLKTALTVFALSYILKILYAKIDSREYIERSVEEIKEKIDCMNEIINKEYEQTAKKIGRKQKSVKVVERALTFNFKPKVLKGLGAVFTGGTSLLGGNIADKVDEKRTQNNEKILENIANLRMEGDPYTLCLENLELMTQKENLVFFNEEDLYYQIPEKVAKC